MTAFFGSINRKKTKKKMKKKRSNIFVAVVFVIVFMILILRQFQLLMATNTTTTTTTKTTDNDNNNNDNDVPSYDMMRRRSINNNNNIIYFRNDIVIQLFQNNDNDNDNSTFPPPPILLQRQQQQQQQQQQQRSLQKPDYGTIQYHPIPNSTVVLKQFQTIDATNILNSIYRTSPYVLVQFNNNIMKNADDDDDDHGNNDDDDDDDGGDAGRYYQRIILSLQSYELYEQERELLLQQIDINSKEEKEYEKEFMILHEDEQQDQLFHDNDNNTRSLCRPNNWKYLQFPTCNTIMEYDILDRALPLPPSQGSTTTDYNDETKIKIKPIGKGWFRQVFHMKLSQQQNFVFKRVHIIDKRIHDLRQILYKDIYLANKEALLMERLTNSPHHINIYGYCATTILAEPILGGDLTKRVIIRNGRKKSKSPFLTKTIDKVNLAIQMAQAIADMHGYKDGAFFHSDLHLGQWMLRSTSESEEGNGNNNSTTTTLKKDHDHGNQLVLNDLNIAEIMDYDDLSTQQQYCKVERSIGGFRVAPEQTILGSKKCTESIDVHALGMSIYSLWTGNWAYNIPLGEHKNELENKVFNGELPTIDRQQQQFFNNTDIDSSIIDLLYKMWEYDGDKRISIFEVLKELKQIRQRVLLD